MELRKPSKFGTDVEVNLDLQNNRTYHWGINVKLNHTFDLQYEELSYCPLLPFGNQILHLELRSVD